MARFFVVVATIAALWVAQAAAASSSNLRGHSIDVAPANKIIDAAFDDSSSSSSSAHLLRGSDNESRRALQEATGGSSSGSGAGAAVAAVAALASTSFAKTTGGKITIAIIVFVVLMAFFWYKRRGSCKKASPKSPSEEEFFAANTAVPYDPTCKFISGTYLGLWEQFGKQANVQPFELLFQKQVGTGSETTFYTVTGWGVDPVGQYTLFGRTMGNKVCFSKQYMAGTSTNKGNHGHNVQLRLEMLGNGIMEGKYYIDSNETDGSGTYQIWPMHCNTHSASQGDLNVYDGNAVDAVQVHDDGDFAFYVDAVPASGDDAVLAEQAIPLTGEAMIVSPDDVVPVEEQAGPKPGSPPPKKYLRDEATNKMVLNPEYKAWKMVNQDSWQ